MGLLDVFGKKTVKCAKCGKEFEKGAFSSDTLCLDCNYERTKIELKEASIRKQQEGIQYYYETMPKPFRKLPADVNTIMSESSRILEKYRRDDVITTDDFVHAQSYADSWSDDECMHFMRRLYSALVHTHKRVSFVPGKFIISHQYNGVVVDFDDVFAIAVVKGFKTSYSTELDESYLCAMFTNNPYFPVISIALKPNIKKGFLSTAAKMHAEAMEIISGAFNTWCNNLTYPVMEIKELQKLVKQESAVRGSISMEMMKALMARAKDCSSPFWTTDAMMPQTMPFGISQTIMEYGYLSAGELREQLMDDKQSEKFWMQYVNRCDAEAAEEERMKAFFNALIEAI